MVEASVRTKVEAVVIVAIGIYLWISGPGSTLNPDVARFVEAGLLFGVTPRMLASGFLVYIGVKHWKLQF